MFGGRKGDTGGGKDLANRYGSETQVPGLAPLTVHLVSWGSLLNPALSPQSALHLLRVHSVVCPCMIFLADLNRSKEVPLDKQLEERRIVRREEVSRLTGLPRATLYQKVKERSFPPPIRLGARSVGWRLKDIDKWLQDPERRWKPPEER